MKAIRIDHDELIWKEIHDPILQEGEVLVCVKAAGVNRADLLQRRGMYPPPEGVTEIMGLELAGDILKINGHSHTWSEGDRVMALVPGGGYATRIKIPIDMLLPIPPALTYEEAAAIPEALYTSYLNLVVEGRLTRGETVLIHSGAGGIGSTAIQVAGEVGAVVITTCGSPEKVDLCLRLGAGYALNYREAPIKQQLSSLGINGIDVVLDTIGSSEYASAHTSMMRNKGRWILIGLLGGTRTEINMAKMLSKNLVLKGSTLRNRSIDEKIRLTKEIDNRFMKLYDSGSLRPVLDRAFPVTEVSEAHRYLAENKVMGKVVLTME